MTDASLVRSAVAPQAGPEIVWAFEFELGRAGA